VWPLCWGRFVWRDQWVFVWDDDCFESVALGFGREFNFEGLCLELELKLQELS